MKVPNFTEAVKLGLIDLKTGMYHDPHTGRKMFLAEAVKKGLIDTTGEMPLVGDDVSSYTLSQAIELGIFDEVTGKLSDSDFNLFIAIITFKLGKKHSLSFTDNKQLESAS